MQPGDKSEYELWIEQNIARNRAKLNALNVGKAAEALSAVFKKAKKSPRKRSVQLHQPASFEKLSTLRNRELLRKPSYKDWVLEKLRAVSDAVTKPKRAGTARGGSPILSWYKLRSINLLNTKAILQGRSWRRHQCWMSGLGF
jgi:hypothetical protein